MFILDVGKEARKRSLITGKKSIFWQHFFRKKKKNLGNRAPEKLKSLCI